LIEEEYSEVLVLTVYNFTDSCSAGYAS
jgi:hypothetical protein